MTSSLNAITSRTLLRWMHSNCLRIGVGDDAGMRSLAAYLYGARTLRVPPEWKRLMPKEL